MLSSLNLSKTFKVSILLFISCLLFSHVNAKEFANTDFYLVEKLVLTDLSTGDRLIIDSCLAVFHQAKADTTRIKALAYICDNIADASWTKFQLFQYEFVREKWNAAKEKAEKDILTPFLVDALTNLGLIEIYNGDLSRAFEYYEESLAYSKKISYQSGRARSYSGMAYVYQLRGESTQSIDLYHKGAELFRQLGDELSRADNLQNIGEIYRLLGNVPQALESYETCLDIYRNHHNYYGQAVCLNNLALVYTNIGNIPKAIDLYTESLEISQTLGASLNIAVTFNNIGELCFNQGEIKNALANYFKGLALYKKITAKANEASCLSNIAKAYVALQEFDSALVYYNESLAIENAIDNKPGLARNYLNIGNMYFRLNQYVESVHYYELSLKLFEDLEYLPEIAICNTSLAQYYYEQNDFVLAEKYALKALETARKVGVVSVVSDASLILSNIAKERGDFKLALEMQEEYFTMRDSIINMDNKALVIRKELEAAFQEEAFQLEEQKLLDEIKLQKQQEKIKEQKYLTFLLISLLVIIALFFLWRATRNKLKIKWLQEKVFKSQMKPHFLFNVLVSIQSLIVQKRDKDAIHYLAEIASYMRSNLIDVSSKSLAIQKELILAEQYLDLEKLRFKEKLEFKIINKLSDQENRIKVPPLITQPILENSIVHGFKDINYIGQITIECLVRGHKLLIILDDNGKGFSGNNEKLSKGLDIVRKRLKLFNSKNTLRIKPKALGTRVEMEICIN